MATVLTPAEIKQKITDWITTNGQHDITGAHLNTILAAIMDYVGVGYAFMGEAPSSAPSPDVPSVYVSGSGIFSGYENGATVVPAGSICLFLYNGSWSKKNIKIISTEEIQLATGYGIPIAKESGYLNAGGGINVGAGGNPFVNTYVIPANLSTVYVTGRMGAYSPYALVAFYDGSMSFISSVVMDYGKNYIDEPITVPDGSLYAKVCTSNTIYQPDVFCKTKVLYDLLTKKDAKVLSSGANLNDLSYGVYSFTPDIGSTLVNSPRNSGGGYIIVENTTPNSFLTANQYYKQVAIYGAGETYCRYCTVNGWTAWESLEITADTLEVVITTFQDYSGCLLPTNKESGYLNAGGGVNVGAGGNPFVNTYAIPADLSTVYVTGRMGAYSPYALAAFYDSSMSFISSVVLDYGVNFYDVPVSVPENAAFVKVCSSNVGYQPVVLCKKYVTQQDENSVPYYWRSYLNNKINTINAKNYSIAGNGDNFVFITDIHKDYSNNNAPKLIEYILKHTSVRNVICGGDLYTNASTQAIALAYLQSVKDDFDFTERFFAIRGNHDSGNSITEGMFYSVFDLPLENVIDTLKGGQSYYFRDNNAQKIRYIFCDCPNYQAAMPTAQIEWLQGKISELESGWTVVVFAHAYWNATAIGQSEQITAYGTSLKNALDGVSATANATIAALIVGHTHADRSLHTTAGYWIISTTCDAGGTLASTYDPVTPTRTAGTTSEQAFDVFNIDTAAQKIYATRIGGNGTDREFEY